MRIDNLRWVSCQSRSPRNSLALLGIGLFAAVLATVSLPTRSRAADPIAADPIATEPSAAETPHPLQSLVDFARERRDHIQTTVRDYSCWLVKRERIGGDLQPYQYAKLHVRCEQRQGDRVITPLAVFMRYVRPTAIRDRRVLYVDGQNQGDMLVRKGGQLFSHAIVRIDPSGVAARRESRYAIREVGFDKIMQRLIDLATDDMHSDPDATNTTVAFFENAKVGETLCTRIEILHPRRADGLRFHKANLFVDQDNQVPIRLVVHDWPEDPEGEPSIQEEYTYLDLRLNVGFEASAFEISVLEEE
jgi:hypothetical protein